MYLGSQDIQSTQALLLCIEDMTVVLRRISNVWIDKFRSR